MPLEVMAVVLAAAALHAAWNAVAKGVRGSDPLVATVMIAGGAAIVAAATLAVVGMPEPASYPYVVASGLIHVAYFLLVGLAYRLADYSVVYPLTRGTAPLLAALAGIVVVGEHLSHVALLGIALLGLGIVGLSLDAFLRGGLDARSLAVAAANIAVIATYTLVDGIGVRASGNPAGYVCAMMLLTGLVLVPSVVWWRPTGFASQSTKPMLTALVAGAMVMASYGAALWAMTRAPIATVAALRETSVLFGTLIAALVLGERFGPARVLATLTILAGLACIRLS